MYTHTNVDAELENQLLTDLSPRSLVGGSSKFQRRNVTCSSPQLRGMRKHSLLSRNSGTYTSPGTPDYRDGNAGGIQKGWSFGKSATAFKQQSEHISAAALMPFNSGRTLPSKWDDAESGPLGAPGVGCFSNYSPAMPVLQGGASVRDFIAGSPFTTGVIVPDGLSIHYGCNNGAQSNPLLMLTGNAMARAGSLPGWSDLLNEKLDGAKDAETMVSRVVSRRDMATQMSPRDSTGSSPKGRSSFSTSPPSILPIVESHSNDSAKLEIRDVQVDKRATVTKQAKKHGVRKIKNGSPDVKNLTSSWDIAEAANNMSKLEREEAEITAWENLQKAKAEAAIRKLEMKLEKKRSASMDKILNKLRIAQMKAQEMRSSKSDSSAQLVAKTSHKVVFFRKKSNEQSELCHRLKLE
ncbi:hypothetical protein TEA_012392 [Camellia sinensis var. sinensis]|uniref:Remorin C-terminal domain-containing protein n=1 Tax=Camellia sinensis var. sinensis TaxID=542762 RepID=A0A4S4DED9_CAMSN|nr:hypothetical protein TEA_012392 [Camellia sinensis var. sinensis]